MLSLLRLAWLIGLGCGVLLLLLLMFPLLSIKLLFTDPGFSRLCLQFDYLAIYYLFVTDLSTIISLVRTPEGSTSSVHTLLSMLASLTHSRTPSSSALSRALSASLLAWGRPHLRPAHLTHSRHTSLACRHR